MMTSEFKLTDAFFKDFRFKILRTTVPLMLAAVSVGWYVAGASVEQFKLIRFGIVLAVVLPISIGRALKRQIRSFRTFKIELTDDRITREQDGLRRLDILFSDIVGVHEVAGKALAIRGKGPHQVLSVPATLERYEELRAQLAQIRLIEARPEKAVVPQLVAGSLVPLVFMVALYRSQSVPVVMVSGSLLIGTLVYCGVVIVRSPHLDRRVKRSSWALVLVLFGAIAKMWFTLVHQ